MDDFNISYENWLKFRHDVKVEETMNVVVNFDPMIVTLKSNYLQEKYTMEVLKGTYD